MADFIVSGQIPGTQIQITFAAWALVIVLCVTFYMARAAYRSKTLKIWVIATRFMAATRSRSIVQG